jgi:transcriptional regulator with XRE-family HTH domain
MPTDDWPSKIRRLRRIRGLKQAALGEMLGVDQSAVSRWERGIDAPNIAAQRRLIDLERSPNAPAQDRFLKELIRRSDGAILTDAQFRKIEVSDAMLRRAGLSRAQIIGDSTLGRSLDGGRRVRALKADGFFAGDIGVCEGVGGIRLNGRAMLHSAVEICPVTISDGTRLMITLHSPISPQRHAEFLRAHPHGYRVAGPTPEDA